MLFERTATLNSVRRPRSQPQSRRGAFALEPADSLPRLVARVARLAERSLEPNPFFLPEFLEPAIRALGRKRVKLATISDRDELRFFAPVIAVGRGILSGPQLRVWTHPYAPLGTPLIDRDYAKQVAESLLADMGTSGRRLLAIPDLPLDGPSAAALRTAAGRRGYATEAALQLRPILRPEAGDGLHTFDLMVAQKRRRELDRQLRRLCETGSVSFMPARTPSEIEAAFNMFIALEASGWKGRKGTALQRRASILRFARNAVLQLAQRNLAAIDVIRLGDRPIAALIRLEHGGVSIPWKIAFDEEFAVFSPGKQLMCDETRRWLLDPAITRVDPVCDEDNPLMAGLWPNRERYGTLIISTRRWALGPRVSAGLMNLRAAGRRRAKALLSRKRPANSTTKKRTRPAGSEEPAG